MARCLVIVLICLGLPSVASALEPGHPNPLAIVDGTETAYLSKVWFRGDKVVAAEFVHLVPASAKLCRKRHASACPAVGSGFSETKLPRSKHTFKANAARKILLKLNFSVNTTNRPYRYWNANKLQKDVLTLFAKRRSKKLETMLTRVVKKLRIRRARTSVSKPAGASGYGAARKADTVVSVPLGTYKFTITRVGAYYFESFNSGFARWYVLDAKLATP